ncbi:hypothetical protein [Draconibacterium orientale]|uniref:hypothetical protein n=1 Tax=Draconibacterium orientale TaxID=1168034 RepID=UPI0029BFB6BF|nr:hypothetical protein [Draconibacterium orientale]
MEYKYKVDKEEAFIKLKHYCEQEKFQGWDPYDGLNSKLFQRTPLKKSRLARLAWIQLFKRNPINLRSILLVPKGYNAKGIGLFLTGYCNLYKLASSGNTNFGSPDDLQKKIVELAELLIKLQTLGYSGACWGYNFDWQNRVFYQPRYTPTVVATSFCADALFNAYEIIKDKKYLKTALSTAKFVTNDLNRLEQGNQLIFSYSPLDTSQVYNASLLGARLLARCYKYSNNENYLQLASKAINAGIEMQKPDGSWYYGADKCQNWIDSYHTGFNLECIWEYLQYSNDSKPVKTFEKGMDFYLDNFFLKDGQPKYYHNSLYPIDIHSPAQLLVTLAKTGKLKSNIHLAENVLNWTIINMKSRKGFYYYQMKKLISSKISYMRWAQAWMFYGYSFYFLKYNESKN